MIKVAVVEDDARIRRVLTEVFANDKDCKCTGMFRDGTSAIAGIPKLNPDVIIMDINLPDISGVDCVARIAPQLPGTQIIMLTSYQDPEMIFRALSAGAHGYLVKPVMPDKLLEAIREVREGGVPMSRTIARKVIEVFHHPPPPQPPNAPPEDTSLKTREAQVLEFLVAGLSYKEISSELDIKPSTVGTYVQRIYEKLHVRSRREIIALHKGASG
jgi:DNA-binding NarL/FixJ family response regulator